MIVNKVFKCFFHDNMDMNKKASVTDAIFGPIKILVLVCTLIIGFFVWSSFSSTFSTAVTIDDLANNASLNYAVSNINVGISTIDYMVPLIVFGLMLISLIMAFKAGSSIIYSIFSILMWAFALMLSAIFTNIFLQFSAYFPTAAANFPIAVYIMTNIKWVILFWLFLISIVMFTRNKSDEQQISASETAFGGYQ